MRIRVITSMLIGVLLILPACAKPSNETSIPKQGPHEVRVSGTDFKPSIIRIPVGTTVTWVGYDGGQHSVSSDTGLIAGSLPPFGSFNYTFTERGTYEYFCQNQQHNGMAGAVVVE